MKPIGVTRFVLGFGVLAGLAAAAPAAEAPVFTDVFVSGAGGYHTFRIPALVVSGKGTLLAFCEGRKTGRGDHGDVDLVLKRSTDGGKSWGPLTLVHEEGGAAKVTIGNPCPVVDADTGTVWLPFCRDNADVFVTRSADDGKTWATPRQITGQVKQSDWDWYATGPGNGIQLRNGPHKGRLLIPCDHRVKDSPAYKKSGRSHVIYSDDRGQTWKLGGVTGPGMNECAVAELDDGSLLLNMRSYRGKQCRAVALSKDGGATWSEPVDVPALVEPVCQASMIRHGGAGGKEGLVFSNPADGKKRHRLTVRLSSDGGKTWPSGRLLHEGPAAYSCLAALPDGTVGCLFERGQKSASETISLARFPVEWVTNQTP